MRYVSPDRYSDTTSINQPATLTPDRRHKQFVSKSRPFRNRNRPESFLLPVVVLLFLSLVGCQTPHTLLEIGDLEPSSMGSEEFLSLPPDYHTSLEGISGSGRLLISQPGNSDRLSLVFHSDRSASLITFRNRVGMEGGKLLATRDSILVYNRIEKQAERYPLREGHLTELGALATVNLTDLFHFSVSELEIDSVYEDDNHFIGFTPDGVRITVEKDRSYILEVRYPKQSGHPYSRVQYESYENYGSFFLPRKITLFSPGGETRLILLVQQLEANPNLPPLRIDLPGDTTILTL
ncbi:MAG: hypothetical protein WD315_07935 [Balneolaceae bacterium]